MSKYFKARSAIIKGKTIINDNVNIWYNAVLRAENNTLTIRENANVQDNVVIHADAYPVDIGKDVTIGHGAIVHGCIIEDNSLIGMGAIILDNAHIGKNCLIGAGTLISENKVIEDNSLVYGSPGKVIRKLNDEEIENIKENAREYVILAKKELEETQN
ncbi:MAG: gamma carbonic anhydrase family protein [Erysipelotrichaceae bacterium]|nr:gamma carbonic anhydrase family protein [Erysipelotrichaceae bacterium]